MKKEITVSFKVTNSNGSNTHYHIPKTHDELIRYVNSDGVAEMFIEKPKTYPVETPISCDPGILFNNNTQSLWVDSKTGLLNVEASITNAEFVDYKEDFVWVEYKRPDLKTGDVAYRTDYRPGTSFSNPNGVCVILNDTQHWSCSADGNIVKSETGFKTWFKLTRKSDL